MGASEREPEIQSDVPKSDDTIYDMHKYPTRKIDFIPTEDGEGYYITDGSLKFRVNHPHDVELTFVSDVFKVHPRSIYMAQLRCPDFKPDYTAKDDFFEDKAFQPSLLAEKIMELDSFFTSQQSKQVYVWVDGYYQPLGEVVVEKRSKELLGREFRKNRYSETLEYIKASTFTNPEEPPINLVNLENGILDIETGEPEPHNPQYYFLNKIPVEYNPEAEAPFVWKFLRDVAGSEEDARILEEVAGYCLLRSYPYHKALALVGEGANGKSTYLALLKEFLGRSNVSARSLVDLELNRFAKSSLYAKMANIYPDLSDDTLSKTGTFKMLTGGDMIEAEEKFKNSFRFVNHAKLLFSCNKLPTVYDNTDAFFRRWIIIVFPNVFEGEDCDEDILGKLTVPHELSGFLNMGLEGVEAGYGQRRVHL